MDYSPKYKVKDIVECNDREDHIVIVGEIETVHSFESKPSIYTVKQFGTSDIYTFTESKISISKVA